MNESKAGMQTTKRRVFCAEDHDDTRQLLSLLLGQSDYEVEAAGTISDGLRMINLKPFDLYLLSGRFPDGSGVELCRRIREFDPLTPILFYSAAAYEADRQSAFSAGAQAYLNKPGNISELINTISQLINQTERAVAAAVAAPDERSYKEKLLTKSRRRLPETAVGLDHRFFT